MKNRQPTCLLPTFYSQTFNHFVSMPSKATVCSKHPQDASGQVCGDAAWALALDFLHHLPRVVYAATTAAQSLRCPLGPSAECHGDVAGTAEAVVSTLSLGFWVVLGGEIPKVLGWSCSWRNLIELAPLQINQLLKVRHSNEFLNRSANFEWILFD